MPEVKEILPMSSFPRDWLTPCAGKPVFSICSGSTSCTYAKKEASKQVLLPTYFLDNEKCRT